MKRILAVLLFAVMLITTACKGGGTEKTSGESKTLKISYFKGGYGEDWIKATGAAFEKENKGVKIEYEGDPGLTEKIGPRLESGANLPDLAFVLKTNWQRWAVKGYLEDLSSVYSADIQGKKFSDKLQPGIVNYGKINGKEWIVPWTDGSTGIVYNAKMFKENGWSVPKTVNELYDLLPKIKAKGIAPFVWGGKVMAYWDFPTIGWWAQYEGAAGIETYKKMASPDVYHQEGRLKALEVFEKLIKDPTNSLTGCSGMDHIQSQMAFVQGKAAMIPNGAWIENEIKSSMPAGFEMKMMQLPAIDGAKDPLVNNTMAGDFAIVPAKAANKELAKKFLEFMARDDMLKLFTEKTGGVRPFQYDALSVNGLTEFNKSAIEIWKNSKNIYLYSDSPLYYNSLYDWPMAGAPYMMIYVGDSTAKDTYDETYTFVKQKWEGLKAEMGLK